MPTVYPPAPPTLSGDLITISRFLQNPTLIARRLRTLLEQRYIADALLTGRFQVSGGAVLYETGESIFTPDDPRAVMPGSEYPLTNPANGVASMAKTVKWGSDAQITDESIKRQNLDPVNRAFIKLANTNVKYIDSVALGAISSAVSQTTQAGIPSGGAAAWSASTTTAQQILTDVLQAKANIVALNQGYDPDTVVVNDISLAYALSKFTQAGYFARETTTDNPALTGAFPVIAGLRWLATPNIPIANAAFVLDSQMLGGMADEDLGGPGYVSAGGVGVQAKTMRDDEDDQWRIRVRRVTVPIVLEPASAWKITSV